MLEFVICFDMTLPVSFSSWEACSVFHGLFVFLMFGGVFVTLQFEKLNCLISNDQFGLVLQAKAVLVFRVFEGGIRLF